MRPTKDVLYQLSYIGLLRIASVSMAPQMISRHGILPQFFNE